MNPPVVSHFLRNAKEKTVNSAPRGTVSPGPGIMAPGQAHPDRMGRGAGAQAAGGGTLLAPGAVGVGVQGWHAVKRLRGSDGWQQRQGPPRSCVVEAGLGSCFFGSSTSIR